MVLPIATGGFGLVAGLGLIGLAMNTPGRAIVFAAATVVVALQASGPRLLRPSRRLSACSQVALG